MRNMGCWDCKENKTKLNRTWNSDWVKKFEDRTPTNTSNQFIIIAIVILAIYFHLP